MILKNPQFICQLLRIMFPALFSTPVYCPRLEEDKVSHLARLSENALCQTIL